MHKDIISREQDGFYLTFFFFWYQKGLLRSVYIGWGRGLRKPLQAHPSSSHFVPFPLTCWRSLLSSEGLSLEENRAQCNGCRGHVGDGIRRIASIVFPHLKFKFMGFVSSARGFLVVELTFLLAGIKVSGSWCGPPELEAITIVGKAAWKIIIIMNSKRGYSSLKVVDEWL